jgi:hypothetical protein
MSILTITRSKETDANTPYLRGPSIARSFTLLVAWTNTHTRAPTFHLPAVVDQPPYQCPWNVAYPPLRPEVASRV